MRNRLFIQVGTHFHQFRAVGIQFFIFQLHPAEVETKSDKDSGYHYQYIEGDGPPRLVEGRQTLVVKSRDFLTPYSIPVGRLHLEYVVSVRQVLVADGMLSYGGVVPFFIQSGQAISITYFAGIQIVKR